MLKEVLMPWNTNLTGHPIFSLRESGIPILSVWINSSCHGNNKVTGSRAPTGIVWCSSLHHGEGKPPPQFHSYFSGSLLLVCHFSALGVGNTTLPGDFTLWHWWSAFWRGFDWLLFLRWTPLGDSVMALLQIPGAPTWREVQHLSVDKLPGRQAGHSLWNWHHPLLPREPQAPQSLLSVSARPKGFR